MRDRKVEGREERGRRQARELRREQTPAEEALWERLRDRQVLGLKFRRQVPIQGYIADFCCPELKIIVELDGAVHLEDAQVTHDRNRDGYLKTLGYTILRFPNEQALLSGRSVVDEVARVMRHLRPALAG
jgi:very-short-patch-repair endonuclease